MKIIFSICLFFFAALAFAAAPLEGGFALVSKTSTTPEEKSRIYIEARNRVIEAAARYENTPYRYGGMTSRGLDCSGLICLSFKDALGVNLPRSASGLYSWAEKISFDNAQPGDLLFFKTGNNNNITHVALYLGGRRFIHSASEGPNTGVIYSTLDEEYWARTYAGTGRAFPEAPAGSYPDNTPVAGDGKFQTKSASGGQLVFGASFAPSWNGLLTNGDIFRGFSSNLGFGANVSFFNMRMFFGIELRQEYDRTLGVFRLPITLSWGPNEKIRIFGGPVLSFGTASIRTNNGVRYYSGGTSWFGALGITVSPYTFKTSHGDFAPYFEAAWQNYFNKDSAANPNADVSAFLRLSTGIRYTRRIR